MRRVVLAAAFVWGAAFLLPAPAHAQVAIAGVVKDSTGAVLPGATVEASSPALIEKTRTVVTDGAGQYRIVDLRPGTYEVMVTMPGFKTVRRADVILEGTFTAQVNAELQVGSVEESVVVTGASPVVDVSGSTTEFVANRDILDAIPTSNRNTPSRALLIPGTQVTPFVLGQYNMSVHGSATSDLTIAIDGMRVNNLCGSGQYSGFYMNDASIQEVTYTTGAESAEMQAGGLRINSVPKDGGNTFSGTFFAYGAGGSLQADNRSDAVKAFVARPAGIAYDWQINPSFGGPLKRDKLWFYFTYKYADNKTYVLSSTFADGSQAFRNSMGNYSGVGRLTWQATSRDKLRFYLEKQFNGEFYNGFNTLPTTSPEASTDAWGRGWVPQVKWTQTTSSKLLLEAGLSYYTQPYAQTYKDTVRPSDLPRVEATTNRLTVAAGSTIPPYTSWTKTYSSMAALTYVTGSHALKAGMTMGWGTNSRAFSSNAQINTLVFNLNAPIAVFVSNAPTTAQQKVKSDFGAFVQDAWTMKRLTLNVGGRFDHFNAEVPAQSSPATPWTAARNFAAVTGVPNWNDFSARLAATYDVFGTGKTAIKGNASKYIASQAAGYAANFNAMTYQTQQRAWVDFNQDRTILNPDGSIQSNEVIGGTSNFGQVSSGGRPDPDLKRGYNWEYNVSLQHELLPRVAVGGGYYRRQFYNLDVTDNLNLAVSDWSTFGIATPGDTRLPTSGQPITMSTLNPTKVGTPTDNLRTFSDKNRTVYNGLEFTANARFSKALLFGGITTDRRAATTCDERDNPNSARFCDAIPPFRTTVKASGVYSFPHDVQVSGTFLARPGPSVAANYTVTAALAGRTIIGSTAGATTIGVNLIQPNTVFLDYQNQLDVRAGKTFRFQRYRVQGFVDVFNVLNAGTVVRVNETFGSNPATNAWLTPTGIVQGRYVRFGTQMSF